MAIRSRRWLSVQTSIPCAFPLGVLAMRWNAFLGAGRNQESSRVWLPIWATLTQVIIYLQIKHASARRGSICSVNAQDDVDSTRDRILTVAMQLFGEQGYSGTRVGQIEAAAGLSRGAGGLYRHFPSKRAILEAGISRAIETGTDLVGLFDDPAALSALPFDGRLLLVAQAALRRLEHDRDLNRLVCRDLAQFPDLLKRVRDEEIVRTFQAFAAWLRHQPETESRTEVDWDGVAAVLIGAMFHYWFLRDTFRSHPTGISEDRYVRAGVALTAALAHDGG